MRLMPRHGARHLAVLLATSILVAGCATPYQKPADAPSATLTGVAMGVGHWIVMTQDSERCPSPPREQLMKFESREFASYAAALKGEPFDKFTTQTREIGANRWMSLEVRSPGAGGYCSVQVMFYPKPEGRYEFTLQSQTLQCAIKVMRLDKDEEGHTRRTPEPSTIQIRDSSSLCS